MPSGPVPRHIRLWVLVAASLVFLAAVMNLVLVAEPAASVSPELRDGVSFQAGSGSAERSGSFSWRFEVDPHGRHLVELDLSVPYVVAVTHVWGSGSLLLGLTVTADGAREASDSHSVVAEPRPDQTERIQRRMTAIGDMGGDVSPLRVEREDAEPFAVVVDWVWSYTGSADAEVSFDAQVQAVSLMPMDAPGIPLCAGLGCARAVFVVALVAQAAAVVWFTRAPRTPKDA